MSKTKGVLLSPKYGVNPTIPICFWCGKEREEVALIGRIGDGRKGEDFEAPMHMVIDYEPCDECKKNMALGFTVMEATTVPNKVTSVEFQKGVYPTGRFVVIKPEAAEQVFDGVLPGINMGFVNNEIYTKMFCNLEGSGCAV